MTPDRDIVQRPGVGVTAFFVQRQRLLLRRLTSERPSLICVRRGAKLIRYSSLEMVVRSGDAVMIDAGTTFDVINQPDEKGAYEAVALAFDPGLLDLSSEAPREDPTSCAITAIKPCPEPLLDSFERTIAAVQNPDGIPQSIAILRTREILAWLAAVARPFVSLSSSSVSRRVRTLVASRPDHPWRAPEVARRLGMSEATLRRHLGSERQHLSKILLDVRMSHALTLLQATDRPIARIALDVGYESAARFATRFRARFGHAPSAIRTRV